MSRTVTIWVGWSFFWKKSTSVKTIYNNQSFKPVTSYQSIKKSFFSNLSSTIPETRYIPLSSYKKLIPSNWSRESSLYYAKVKDWKKEARLLKQRIKEVEIEMRNQRASQKDIHEVHCEGVQHFLWKARQWQSEEQENNLLQKNWKRKHKAEQGFICLLDGNITWNR